MSFQIRSDGIDVHSKINVGGDDDAYCRLNKVCLYKREPRGDT